MKLLTLAALTFAVTAIAAPAANDAAIPDALMKRTDKCDEYKKDYDYCSTTYQTVKPSLCLILLLTCLVLEKDEYKFKKEYDYCKKDEYKYKVRCRHTEAFSMYEDLLTLYSLLL